MKIMSSDTSASVVIQFGCLLLGWNCPSSAGSNFAKQRFANSVRMSAMTSRRHASRLMVLAESTMRRRAFSRTIGLTFCFLHLAI